MTDVALPPLPSRLTEPRFTNWLWETLRPIQRPAYTRAALEGLCLTAPAAVRRRVQSELIWPWQCSRIAAPDLLIGDADDNAVAMFEFKSRTAAIQWTSLATYRVAKKGSDPLSKKIAANVHPGVPAELELPHFDEKCVGLGHPCVDWKWAKNGRHRPCVHQGDMYATTTEYFGELKCTNLRDVPGIFVAPHAYSAQRWQKGLRSTEHWTILMVADAIGYWRTRVDDVPELATLIDALSAVTGN